VDDEQSISSTKFTSELPWHLHPTVPKKISKASKKKKAFFARKYETLFAVIGME
jgi:hypothetical protein